METPLVEENVEMGTSQINKMNSFSVTIGT